MTEDGHGTIALDLELVDKLAADYLEDFKAFLSPLRSSTVSWAAAGETFSSQMHPEGFLAWAWRNRRVIITDRLKRSCVTLARTECESIERGMGDEDAVRSVFAELDRKSGERSERIDGARQRFRGQLAFPYDVPGKGSVPLGLMDRSDLLAVSVNLGTLKRDLGRRESFVKALRKGLPEGALVGERYSEEKVESMWATFSALAR